MTRFFRREVNEQIYPLGMPWDTPSRAILAPWSSANSRFCDFAQGAVNDAEFAFDLLVGRGMDPHGSQAESLSRIFCVRLRRTKSVTQQACVTSARAPFTASNKPGRVGYVAARPDRFGDGLHSDQHRRARRQAGRVSQSTLGPYDYWAIEYAYKPMNAATVEAEEPELRKIASRAAEPLLAYDTDEDAGLGPGLDMDPVVNRFDLGTDPLKYYASSQPRSGNLDQHGAAARETR